MILTDIDQDTAIISLFPKSVYCKNNLLLSELDNISNSIAKLNSNTVRTNQLYVSSSHLTNDKIHTLDDFKIVSTTILDECKKFAGILGYTQEQQDKLKYINMWFNLSTQGEFNFPHTHNGSLFSGVIYLKAVSENIIAFHDFNDISIEPYEPNNLSFRTAYLKCVPGTLYIFKSDLVHSNPRQDGEGTKLIISFNIKMVE